MMPAPPPESHHLSLPDNRDGLERQPSGVSHEARRLVRLNCLTHSANSNQNNRHSFGVTEMQLCSGGRGSKFGEDDE